MTNPLAEVNAGQRWYRSHRGEILKRGREQYRQERELSRATKEEFERVYADQSYEAHNDIRDGVFCRVSKNDDLSDSPQDCGMKMQRLGEAHLHHYHRLTVADYRARFPGASLTCSDLRDQISSDSQKKRGPYRLRVRDWTIAVDVAAGKQPAQIARERGLSLNYVRRRARALGLEFGRHDLGRRMTNACVLRVLEASGLDLGTFANIFGVTRRTASEISQIRNAEHCAAREWIHKFIDERYKRIREIAELACKPGRHSTNSNRALVTLFPEFREMCGLLRKVLSRTRKFLRQPGHLNLAIEDWQDWLCREARAEIAGRPLRDIKPLLPGMSFRNFLPLAPEISEFLEPHLGGLRDQGKLSSVVKHVLGPRFGIGPSVIFRAQWARPLSIADMQDVLRRAMSARSRGGRPTKADLYREVKLRCDHQGLKVSQVVRILIREGKLPPPQDPNAETKLILSINKGIKRLPPTNTRPTADREGGQNRFVHLLPDKAPR